MGIFSSPAREASSPDTNTSVSQDATPWLYLFFPIFVLYLIKPWVLITPDTLATSLWALNFFETGHKDFLLQEPLSEAVRVFFPIVEVGGGYSRYPYPPGMLFLTLPFYLVVYLLLGSLGLLVPVLSPEFEPVRIRIEVLIASALSVGSLFFFYSIVKDRFSAAFAVRMTLLLALATPFWPLLSSNLWSQTGCCFIALAGVWLQGRDDHPRGVMTWGTGFCAGLLPCLRPTMIPYSAAIFYLVIRERKKLPHFFGGVLSAAVPCAIWNSYFWGDVTGPYRKYSPYLLSGSFQEVFLNLGELLFSPWRGLLVFCPLVLLVLPAARSIISATGKQASDKILVGASLLVLFEYALNRYWHGGASYGPRYLSVTIPFFLLGSASYIRDMKDLAAKVIFSLLLVWSLLVSFAGVFDPFSENTSIVQRIISYSPPYLSALPSYQEVLSPGNTFLEK